VSGSASIFRTQPDSLLSSREAHAACLGAIKSGLPDSPSCCSSTAADPGLCLLRDSLLPYANSTLSLRESVAQANKVSDMKSLGIFFVLLSVACLSACTAGRDSGGSDGEVVNKQTGFANGVPDPGLFVVGISHLNVVVDDMEYATEFYGRTLGFVQAHNARGVMDYKGLTRETFARDAGFLDGRVNVDIRFLIHPTAGLYLELMKYHDPVGSQEIIFRNTNDLGGIRHVALEVSDAEKVFYYLKEQPDVRMINNSSDYGPPEELTPVTIKFFYWLDPWGVQWEMEEGRPIGTMRGISG
jgi:catechol 2,3-dioxygenase-like lactoylglutathione lyase family enzyme